MIKDDSLYLSIAGFVIKVCFEQNQEFLNLSQSFKQKISYPNLNHYYEEKPKKHDFLVTIIYENHYEVLVDTKTKNHLIGFYKEITPKHFYTFHHISAEQFMVLIRDIIQLLLAKKEKGLIIHGSAVIDKKERGCIFLGKSGAGKSTIVKLLSPEYTPIADDILIIKKEKSKYVIYQTPFLQKNSYHKVNKGYFILKNILILKKGEDQQINALDTEEQLAFLAEQIFTDQKNYQSQLKFLWQLTEKMDKKIAKLTFGLNKKIRLIELLN